MFMLYNWRDYTCLIHGTDTQRAACAALQLLKVFDLFGEHDPVLAGTIPLDIDVPGSDLDIICHASDVEAFARQLQLVFGHHDGFTLRHAVMDGLPTVIARFSAHGFPFEIFGQPHPAWEQQAVRHLEVTPVISVRP